MIELLYRLLGYAYWAGLVAVVVWWVWSVRKAQRPRRRTSREEAELTALREALARGQRSPAARGD